MKAMGMTFGRLNDDEFHFFSPHITYHVTNFQRSYTWNEYQIYGFIQDLEYMKSTGLPIGWPSILLQESRGATPNKSKYYVGDGQQRITTICLALLAICQNARKRSSEGTLPDPKKVEYFENLMYGTPSSPVGAMASHSYDETGILHVEPRLKFYSEETNDAFSELFGDPGSFRFIATEIAAHNDGSVRAKTSEENMKRNFSILFDFFSQDSKGNLDVLKNYAELILEKINLSVLIYKETEDMQRSFSRMNTYGMALNPEELIKAEIYGTIRKDNPRLAEKIVEYWTEHLESGNWSNRRFVSHRNATADNASSHLEKFLVELSCIYTDWTDIIDRGKTGQRVQPQWLRDRWMDILGSMKPKDYPTFWESFKDYLRIYEVAMEDSSRFNVDTLDWEINYTSHVIGQKYKLGAIMKIAKCAPSDEDAISTLVLLRKLYFYAYFVENDMNIQQRIIEIDSPILEDVVRYEDMARHLEQSIVSNRAWLSEDRIAERLERKIYDSSRDSSNLNELFIFVANEEHRERGVMSNMLNTREILSAGEKEKITREHILAQSPGKGLTENEKAEHFAYINRIGNSMPLARSGNSSAGKKEISEKLRAYKKSASGWGVFWSNDLQEVLDSSKGVWGYEQINQRSKNVSKKIAKHISPEKPYSDFTLLSENIEKGTRLTTSIDDHSTVFTVSENGYLLDSQESPVRTLVELKEASGAEEGDRVKTLELRGETGESVGFLRWNAFTQKPDYSEKGFKKSKVSLLSDLGEYQDTSGSKLLSGYLEDAFKKDKQVTLLALANAGVKVHNKEIYENSSFYKKIPGESGYVKVNVNQVEVERIIRAVAERLEDTLEFEWS